MVNSRPRPRLSVGHWISLSSAILLGLLSSARAYGARLADRYRAEPDAGYSTEFVVLTAAIVAVVVGAVALLGKKIMAKINGLNL